MNITFSIDVSDGRYSSKSFSERIEMIIPDTLIDNVRPVLPQMVTSATEKVLDAKIAAMKSTPKETEE